ncbi:MAG: GNAT family N-acetyltransferase [Rhodobacteraceae bacterium]|nr:GNAT family N-acetyltransferase [Paracoccaceae bacterium]
MFALSIKTKRLVLRPFTPADAPRVRELADEWDIARMTASIPHPYPEGLAEKWIAAHDGVRTAGKGYPFAITLDGTLIGSVGADRNGTGALELGYWLGKPYWGRGIVTEAAAAVLDFCFGWLAVDRVYAGHLAENVASSRVLQKLGFAGDGCQERKSLALDKKVSCQMVVLTKDAWLKDTAAAKRV